MKVQFLFLYLLILFFPYTGNISAQIKAVGANWKDTTYQESDTLYVFYQYPNNKSAHMTASAPGGGNADFFWSMYDTTTHTYGTPFKTENNVLSSEIYGTANGGYQVNISDGKGLDTTFRFWVFLDTMELNVEKDENGEVKYFLSTCDYVDLNGTGKAYDVTITNPATGNDSVIHNTLAYSWSADPVTDAYLKQGSANIRVYGPPYKDTKFTLTATDKFGMKLSDNVKYISIVPHADFSIDAPTKTFQGAEKHSAPLSVTITNNSENADTFTWFMGDGDTLYTANPDPHVYYKSGTYTIRLVTEKGFCIDSTKQTIAVDEPQLQDSLTNVFVPEEGNFKFDNISIKAFKITIVSRWGKKVYEWEGPMEKWVGWDGNIGNSKASPGVYYYYLQVTTFDNKPEKIQPKGVYKGFFYLFRSN